VRKADNRPPSCAVVTKSGKLNFLEPSGPLQACNGTAFKGGRCVGLTNLPPSCADYLASKSWNLQGLFRPVTELLYIFGHCIDV